MKTQTTYRMGNQTNNKQGRWESGCSRFFSLAIILELSLHIYSIFPLPLQQMHRPQTCFVTAKLLESTYQVFKRTPKGNHSVDRTFCAIVLGSIVRCVHTVIQYALDLGFMFKVSQK